MASNNMANLMQRALFLKNLRAQFEGSMNDGQKVSFVKDCDKLAQAILDLWNDGGDEKQALEAVAILSPCLPPEKKKALFSALEFRGFAKKLTARYTQLLTDDQFQARIDKVKHDAVMLSSNLIDASTPETESLVLEAIAVIEDTLKEVQIPIISRKAQQIETPKFYFS